MDPVLESRIRRGARQGALPHSVIFSGSGDLLAAARFYTAALECRQADKPCLRCPACGKVLRGTHPDCVTAEDSQHKDLSVEVLRPCAPMPISSPTRARARCSFSPTAAA